MLTRNIALRGGSTCALFSRSSRSLLCASSSSFSPSSSAVTASPPCPAAASSCRYTPVRGFMPSWMRKKQTAMYEAKGNVRPEKMDWKDRLPKPRFQIRILEQEEIARIHKEHPREVEEFRAGDKIKVTKYLSLQSDKTEVVRGMVLARNKGTRLNATFTLINRRLGDVFELTLPLHSPFITKIEVMDKRPDDPVFKRNKLYHVARMNPKVFQC